MKVSYGKVKEGVYHFYINFSDEEKLDYNEITSEVKCALLGYTDDDLSTSDFNYELDSSHSTNIDKVDEVEFFYELKGNSKILLYFKFLKVSGYYKFKKIELKYSGDLSIKYLDSIANKIKKIVEHLFNQRGRLCVNCVWKHIMNTSGFCDHTYFMKPFYKK